MSEKANKINENFVSVSDLFRLCLARWRWFVASILICLVFAVYYLQTAPKLYTRYAAVLVREETQGNNSSDYGNEFDQLGFVKQNNNMENILRHITSLEVLMEVALRLDSTLFGDQVVFAALDIQRRLSVEASGLKSTVLDMTYKASSIDEAEQTLLLIVQVYNEKCLEQKQKMTYMTSKFIEARLELLERDLDIVDDSIAIYKSSYGITDLEHVSNIYLRQQSESDAEIMRLSSQREMADYIRSLLEENSSSQQLLLVNSGIENKGIETQITLYNDLLLDLQSHLKYTSEQNPMIIRKEEELNNLRLKILSNIKNHIHSLDIQLGSLIDYNDEATSKVTSNPAQAKYLSTIERERKVKESLYMFLLQKKEENEVSVTYQTESAQIIDIPNGSYKPSSPQRIKMLFAAIFLGFLLPTTILFFRVSFDESVRDRHDIERNSDIPFLGEVPYSGREHSLESLLMQFGIGRKAKSGAIVVGSDMLNASNEAFRVLRNNMDSIAAEKFAGKGGRVYLIKSTQIEVGKTFVAMNLALIKAIGGQRVLFIDGDLRQASASRLWRTPLLGLTDYLHGEESDYRKLLWHPEVCPTLDVLPAGALPTNPTEILQNPRLDQLIETLKQQYDCILIDSPTAGILADADIMERVIDCTLFIIRAGQFNRHRLNELSPIEIINGKAKPQYIILNGVSVDTRYGYTYSHKYERTEEEKSVVEISKTTILLNKIIFRKRHHNTQET